MKNICLAAICVCVILYGCKKDETETTIIGKWQVESYGPLAKQVNGVWLDGYDKPYESTNVPPKEVTGSPWIWEINADMTFKYQWSPPAGAHMPSSGTYTYVNNLFTPKGGTSFEVVFGKNKTMTLIELSYASSNNGLIPQKVPFELKRIE